MGTNDLPIPGVQPEDEPIDELLERRCRSYERQAENQKIEEKVVTIPTSEPFGIVHLGDPHLDDDGTDLPLLRKHVKLIQDTPGLYASCIGDVTNNWAGRLGMLWASQGTSCRESWRLAEWLITSVPWVFFVKGNHDLWSGPGSGALDWILQETTCGASGPHDLRIRLEGEGWTSPIRIWARHSWPGMSIWHPLHGQVRAAKMAGYPADILIGGHTHNWGYHLEELPGGQLSHCVQIGSYKKIDGYSLSLGYRSQVEGAACVTIIDPMASTGTGRISVLWDVDEAARYLTYLRAKG